MQLGKIKAHYGSEMLIRNESGITLKIKNIKKSGHVVGDDVQISKKTIIKIRRRNHLARKTTFGIRVLAANLEYVGIVISIIPKVSFYLINQIIISSRVQGIKPFIIITKPDLPGAKNFFNKMHQKFSLNLPVLFGIQELQFFLLKKHRFIFVGLSGSGKSSLINAFTNQKQKIAKLNNLQGKHTTSNFTLFTLNSGAEIIDCPGIKNFIPIPLTFKSISKFFPGFEKFIGKNCRFRNCKHLGEPNCIVKKLISSLQYEQYFATCNLTFPEN